MGNFCLLSVAMNAGFLNAVTFDNNVAKVKEMVKNGIDVNQSLDSWRHTWKKAFPSVLAACYGKLESLKVVLEAGAHLELKSSWFRISEATALWFASWNGGVEMVKELLKRGADADSKATWRGEEYTCLEIAVKRDKKEVAELLKSEGRLAPSFRKERERKKAIAELKAQMEELKAANEEMRAQVAELMAEKKRKEEAKEKAEQKQQQRLKTLFQQLKESWEWKQVEKVCSSQEVRQEEEKVLAVLQRLVQSESKLQSLSSKVSVAEQVQQEQRVVKQSQDKLKELQRQRTQLLKVKEKALKLNSIKKRSRLERKIGHRKKELSEVDEEDVEEREKLKKELKEAQEQLKSLKLVKPVAAKKKRVCSSCWKWNSTVGPKKPNTLKWFSSSLKEAKDEFTTVFTERKEKKWKWPSNTS